MQSRYPVFASYLRNSRHLKGLSQAKAAADLDVSRVTYNRWESGEVKPQDHFKPALEEFAPGIWRLIEPELVADFGTKIRNARKKRGLNMNDFARAMRMSMSTGYAIELGAKVPRLDLLIKIEDFLRVELRVTDDAPATGAAGEHQRKTSILEMIAVAIDVYGLDEVEARLSNLERDLTAHLAA